MEENTQVIPVTIQPKTVYGIRTDVKGNVHFTLKQEVVYPVEGVLAFHNYPANQQKFLRLPEHTDPVRIIMSPNRKYLGVQEKFSATGKETNSIKIYDLNTFKIKKTIPIPLNSENRESEIESMIFTSDSKAFAMITKLPDELLILFLFDKNETVLQTKASNPNTRGTVECVASNPNDPGQLAVAGENLFKILGKAEKSFAVTANMKAEGVHITTMSWLSMDVVIAGTASGHLLFIENAEIRVQFVASVVEYIDLMKTTEAEEGAEESTTTGTVTLTSSEIELPRQEYNILCMNVFPRGFAYAIYNQVYVFEKESKFSYARKTILILETGIYPEPSYSISNMAINHQQDTVIVTAQHAQIYVGVLIVPDSLHTKSLTFDTLGEPLHVDEIIDISLCMWKPIILTASKDQTVRIWNYETGKVELVKKYQVDIAVIELNPTGLLAAIAFTDQLRIMEIFLDDLQIMKTYNFPRCHDVIFSNYGHFMAAAHDNLIAITSVYTLEILKILKGHNSDVMSVAWSRDDKYLVSGGVDGAVYQWDVSTGARIHEVVQKGIEYRKLQVTNDPLSIYAITNMGTLREIMNSEVVREIKPPMSSNLMGMTLSRSDAIMFMSSEEGHLFNVQLPFLDAGGGRCTNFRFFTSAITRMQMTYDGTLLLTASSRGTLVFWVMKNIEGRVASIDQDVLKSTNILIPRKSLIDKIESIQTLNLRLQQQVEEFTYQISQNNMFNEQETQELHKRYNSVISELKERNQHMESQHIEELNQITNQIHETKEEYQAKMNTLSSQFSARMLVEYQKIQQLRENMVDMREKYEEKLKQSADCLQDTIEALETDFMKQLQERQELIRQLMQEMEDKKIEFVEYCRQVETDNDRNMVSSQLQYENKLQKEQAETMKWRGEAGVLRKKYNSIQKQCEDLEGDIETLKEELNNHKQQIKDYESTIAQHKHEVAERDDAIGEKEKRIQTLQNKNIELEKYKPVLMHKIAELKSQIEPRELQIKEKRNQIAEMERELEGLHANNQQLQNKFSELTDKYVSSQSDLKMEIQKFRQAKSYIEEICSDIYHLSTVINNPPLLREGYKKLFQKYSNENDLKQTVLLKAEVQFEFQRQRDHMEKLAASNQQMMEKRREPEAVKKLLHDNMVLLKEVNSLRVELKNSRDKVSRMESLLGITWQKTPVPHAREKLEKAVANFDQIQKEHQAEIAELKHKLHILETKEMKQSKHYL